MSLPIARNWYRKTGLSNNISLIIEHHVSADLRCNIWHIRGRDQDLLIDTGLGVAPLQSSFSELRERPLWAIASHTHFDHVGCHHEFTERLCHPAEAGTLANPDSRNTVWSEYRATCWENQPLAALPFEGFSFDRYRIKPAPPTRLIDEGDELDLGNRLFRVFHMPGHSPGSLCIYEPATRILFTGDVLYDGALLDALYHSDPEQYRETLARLKEIPAEVFHCGHYGSFGRETMLKLIDHYLGQKS